MQLRVPHCLRVDTDGVAEPRADEVEIMDAVIKNLQPRRGRKKGPQLPRRVGANLNFHIVQLAEQAQPFRAQPRRDYLANSATES